MINSIYHALIEEEKVVAQLTEAQYDSSSKQYLTHNKINKSKQPVVFYEEKINEKEGKLMEIFLLNFMT
jgi:hypothetical protein